MAASRLGKRMGPKVQTTTKVKMKSADHLKPTTKQAMSVQRTGPRLPRDEDMLSLNPFSARLKKT